MPRISRRALAALAAVWLPAGLIAGTGDAYAASLRSAGAIPAVRNCGTGAALVRPRTMILTCADHGEVATGLTWSSWSAAGAMATGRVTWRTCLDCSGSRVWASASARFALTGPVAEPGGRVLFMRLRLEVTGATPAGFRRDLTFSQAPQTSVVPRTPAGPSHAAADGSRFAGPPSRGVLGYAAIEGYWIDAGGPASAARTAAAITGAESSFLPGNIEEGYSYGETGWGLWQIDPGNSVPADGINFQLLDPWNNAEAAVSKYDRDLAVGEPGFEAWTTWTTGDPRPYERYLQSVRPDAALSDPGEYVQYDATPKGTPASPPADPGRLYGPSMPGMLTAAVGSPASGEVMNYTSQLCLGVTAGNVVGYAVQSGCSRTAAQSWRWRAEDGDNGYYQLTNGQGECLGITYGRTTSGARAVVWTCDGHADQYWRPLTAGAPAGYLYLQNLKSGDALGVSGGSAASGAAVRQRSWQDALNYQLWT